MRFGCYAPGDPRVTWSRSFSETKVEIVRTTEARDRPRPRFLGPALRRRILLVLGAAGSVASIVSLVLYFLPAGDVDTASEPPTDIQGVELAVNGPASGDQTDTLMNLPDPVGSRQQQAGQPEKEGIQAGAKLGGSHPRVGETFELEVGQEVRLFEIQTIFALRLVKLGTQDEEALRINIIPPDAKPISRDLIGQLGRVEFEAQDQRFGVIVLRLAGENPRVSFTVTPRSFENET